MTPGEGSAPTPAGRGPHLVTVLGCDDCHTPWVVGPEGPAPDMSRRLSGPPDGLELPPPPELPPGPWIWTGAASPTAYAGPWGISYATGLTPDSATGIGARTLETFVATIRNGRKSGAGRPLLPPMPWPGYAELTGEDLAAIFAFLQTLPPVRNRVPPAEIAGTAP